ncbi:DUF2461 domain-containing protein [Nocardia cyriacigeorgica]|uniref:DUF2461 domain-containing protein n=1 Tax=Nocardia cyriacigeorgica (strain GUH-2) TaxID=1127134 RepID=H6R9A5_NOCCG|nr:DUF2461 domain-containing protein [Nocardia cyriacigeorgica]CCF64886.1 conserved protein of unknown function [Nocardia cyriacigeorgica GUH-2]
MGRFGGFPFAGLDFYEDLEADNSKTFWAAHKQVYDESVKAPMLALIEELEADFGSAKLFRPYRDVRFSKDKSPYKTHQGVVVGAAPGVGWYVQIGAAGLFVAAGFYGGSADQLARLRTTIDDDVRGPELAAILTELAGTGYEIGGDRLKTQPKGYPADHPRIELLRHKTLTTHRDFGAPDWLPTPRAATEIRAAWEAQRPLVEWLAAVVGD